MSGQGHMSGQDMGQGQDGQSDAARIEAWRQWHERMAQRHMQGRGGGEQGWRDRGPGRDYYGDYDRDRWAQGDYYDRGPRYRGRSGERGAMGYDDRRWRGPGDQSYMPDYYERRGDYYSDRGGWRGPRYDRGMDDGSGYTYRDDEYGRGYGDYGGRDDWSARQDWGYRDRRGDWGDWRGGAQGYRDDWRGGRWHGEDRWSSGSADTYDRYPDQGGAGATSGSQSR